MLRKNAIEDEEADSSLTTPMLKSTHGAPFTQDDSLCFYPE
jgi:hypothetical protein